jgi:integrase/recombinase XerD
MSRSELAVIEPDRFQLAWPAAARDAEGLTRIWLERFKSEHTRYNYARDLTAWLAWCSDCRISPAEARLAHVDLWIRKQLDEGAADASVVRRISAVSSWYKYMIANTADDAVPLATRNPTVGCARPDVDQDFSPTIGLSRTEADRLIAAADNDSPTVSAFVRLLLITGLRVGSVMAAKIDDLGYDSGHRVLTLIRKGGHADRVAIPPAVGEAIDRMLAHRDNPTSGLLFLTDRGRPLYNAWSFRLLKRLGRIASVPQAEQLSAHSMRATAITELLRVVPLQDVQDFARHRDPRTTRRYDKQRGNLDRAGSYVLAGRYGQRAD